MKKYIVKQQDCTGHLVEVYRGFDNVKKARKFIKFCNSIDADDEPEKYYYSIKEDKAE